MFHLHLHQFFDYSYFFLKNAKSRVLVKNRFLWRYRITAFLKLKILEILKTIFLKFKNFGNSSFFSSFSSSIYSINFFDLKKRRR